MHPEKKFLLVLNHNLRNSFVGGDHEFFDQTMSFQALHFYNLLYFASCSVDFYFRFR